LKRKEKKNHRRKRLIRVDVSEKEMLLEQSRSIV